MKQEYDFSKGKRGAVVPVPQGKTRVAIRLDDDLLDWFRKEVDKAGEGNYRTLINVVLRDFGWISFLQLLSFPAPWRRICESGAARCLAFAP